LLSSAAGGEAAEVAVGVELSVTVTWLLPLRLSVM
jgi:hypothetical protein